MKFIIAHEKMAPSEDAIIRVALAVSRVICAMLVPLFTLSDPVRFELTRPFRVCRFSKPVHSTALPQVLINIEV